MTDVKIRELREQYDKKEAEANALLGKGAEITAEDVLSAKAINDELKGIIAQIDTINSAAGISAELAASRKGMQEPMRQIPHAGGGTADTWFQPEATLEIPTNPADRKGYANFGGNPFGDDANAVKSWNAIRDPGYKDAFRQYLRRDWHRMGNAEQKVLQEGIDTLGGFLVPDDFLNRIISRRPTPTRIASRATQLTTSRDAIAIPKVIWNTDDLYTTGMRVTWTGEIPATATVHQTTEPVFGQVRIPIYTAMMSLPVTLDLLEDSAVDLQAWLEDKFFETYELLLDNMILNGTGIGQPTGILVNPGGTDQPSTVASGHASQLTPDGIINLGWSLPEQYDEDAVWIMNKTNTGRQVALLKDAEDRYLWGMGTHDSGLSPPIRGRELLGSPVIFSGFMPNVAAGTFPIIYGSLRGIYVVRKVGFSVQVLREVLAQTNQVLLLARFRIGAALAEPWAARVQVVST